MKRDLWSTRDRTGALSTHLTLLAVAGLTTALALLCLAGTASAIPRSLYVADGLSANPGSVSQFRLKGSGKPLALHPPTVQTGDSPQHLALTPDGRFAYATAADSGQLFAYRVSVSGTLTPLDPPAVPAGLGAHGVVVSPDGRSAYVGNQDDGSVSQYDIAADGTLSPKDPATIVSGSGESGVAMAPDGRSVYVTNLSNRSVGQFTVNPKTGALSAKPRAKVVVPVAPSGLAVNPDGESLYVATLTGKVFQFTIRRNGSLKRKSPAKVKTGRGASGVAITTRGDYLYTPNSLGDSVSQFRIDRRSGKLTPLRPASIRVGDRPEGVAVSPDGRSLFVAIAGENGTRWLTIGKHGRLRGAKRPLLPSSPGPHGLVVNPDQSPVAVLDPSAGGKAKRKITFRAEGSYDPDGRIARYRWRFGDGQRVTTSKPVVRHRYRRPGAYRVRLNVVDNEGCSGQRRYTGQSALCSGGRSNARIKVRVRRPGTRPPAGRTDGSLARVPGSGGCVVDSSRAARNCTPVRGLRDPGTFVGSHGIALSPNGRQVYVASSESDAVAVLKRDPRSGVLTQAGGRAGCVAAGGAEGCAPAIGFDGPASVTVSPDGRSVYVASLSSNSVTAFTRDRASGALTQIAGAGGCVSTQSIAGCATGRALEGANSIAVSPDGKNVYVAAFNGDGIARLDRGPHGALSQPAGISGCVTNTPVEGCATGVGLDAVESVTVSPDGRRVFATGAVTSSVVSFNRDAAGTLTLPAGGCLGFPASEGCGLAHATLAVNDVVTDPDGSHVYVTTASSTMASFTSDENGIHQLEGSQHCLADGGSAVCGEARSFKIPEALVVSPDGRNIYVAATLSSAVVALSRSRSGAFSQLPGEAGCLSVSGEDCAKAKPLLNPAGIAISPDGRFVYVTAAKADAVTIFRRSAG